MISRAEQVFYGVIGVVALVLYGELLEAWVLSHFPNSGLAEKLLFSLVAWALSVTVVWLLIMQIKRRARESQEAP